MAPGYHRLHETTSGQVFGKYLHGIINAATALRIKRIIRSAENCSKLSRPDLNRLILLSLTRQQELKGVKLSYNSANSIKKQTKGKSPKIEMVTKKQAIEATGCPPGSFDYVVMKKHRIKGEAVNGRYTYFYDKKIIDILSEKYKKK